MLITPEMLISDVIKRVPGAAEVMNNYGLHCTSCSVNMFEEIKAGAMGHGIPEETADEMLAEINKLAGKIVRRAPDNGIYLTEFAAQKIKEFAKAENKEGYGLKISAEANGGNEPAYSMDFQEKAKKGEKTFEFHGVQIFLDKESLKNMAGAEIDFMETQFGSGFKIDNPNYKAKKSCACEGHEEEESSSCCGGDSCGCK